ncbi:MAG: hypothetical protein IPM96_18315 [Ignavibacteria bacterium]|nr:hypothetical protein [Ignavibacteria bacterium]
MLLSFAVIALIVIFSNQSKSSASNALPSWSVTVHYEFGTGLVPDAQVYIKKDGNNQFNSPQTTNGNGFTYLTNGGSSFPNGTYQVSATKFGFGPGTPVTVVISGGVPTNPVTNVNIGTPE